MGAIPWQMLSEASITYATSRGIDLDYQGLALRYQPSGGLRVSDYEFFGVEPPDESPAPLIDRWYHPKNEQPPASFPHGPVRGTQEQLTASIFSTQRGRTKPDARLLHRRAMSGTTIWVRKIHRTQFEVWFALESEYNRVGHGK